MLCNGKYYIGCAPGLLVQITKADHERIRIFWKEPLVEVPFKSPEWTWIDDPKCDEPSDTEATDRA